ncbi:uncharacterized protein LOC127864539 [Dreissena polymorpha]|uniref:Uncharacterized protein n=1 Tax=Dreissena polymorpha TaxID=45954 RepID=A0A9D4NNI2_DREPO|nr:uncharacterized protein LOC127864539 [Dreissena polymorpha]KAH3897099.1 hypothetical protein DPMN_021283 [Dreissena polymorpha]
MDSSDEERPIAGSLMEEALKILKQEGFTLPGDVVETLETVGRTNAAARQRGSLRGHRVCEVQSNSRKMRNTREHSSGRRPSEEGPPEDTATNTEDERVSRFTEASKDTRSPSENGSRSLKSVLQREGSGDSSSTCSASTIKERQVSGQRGAADYTDHSSCRISSDGKARGSRQTSLDGETGYNTSIENAMQIHEARAENLKNLNKDIEEKLSRIQPGGMKREISRDSGFTEACSSPYQSLAPRPTQQRAVASNSVTQDFNDIAVSNSNITERFVTTDKGDLHSVTSVASDHSGAEMVSTNNEVTGDGTVVSSSARLENQESNSTMLNVVDKNSDCAIAKEENYESVNKSLKSSKKDIVSTTDAGVTTAATRHALSVEQGLYKESKKQETSANGLAASGEIRLDQQLARNQEINNIETSDDGTSTSENKNIHEKSLTSKTMREERFGSDNDPISGTLIASQNIDQNTKHSENVETKTLADGSVIKSSDESQITSENESCNTQQKTVKKLAGKGGSSVETVNKSSNTSVTESSKKRIGTSISDSGKKSFEESEDTKSVSSSFSGQCESTEIKDGVKLHRTMSSENSSESKVKSTRSVTSHSNSVRGVPETDRFGRQLSDSSDDSSVHTNVSGLSRENIQPPTYEETLSNLSRSGSLASVFSRQDSSASSIASSAGAFNERQRQKQEARDNYDKDTKRPERKDNFNDQSGVLTRRLNSYSSDSTLSADCNDYNSPVRREDNSYTRSWTAPDVGQSRNRRVTLQGAGELTQQDLVEARRSVRSTLRGHDDMHLNDVKSRGSFQEVDFDCRETKSFKKEVMDIVDRFFDDGDDDGFGMGLKRRKNRTNRETERNIREITNGRNARVNPYATRDDLSAFQDLADNSNTFHSHFDSSASDSGFPVSRNSSRIDNSTLRHRDISDTVSDSGKRFSKYKTSESQEYCDNRLNASHRQRGGNGYQFSNTIVPTATYDNAQRQEKSIFKGSDGRQSMCSRRDDFRIADKITSDSSGRSNFARNQKYNETTGQFRVNDRMTESESMQSLPSDVSTDDIVDFDRTLSLPDVTQGPDGRFRVRGQPGGGGDTRKDLERKERIDKALSWIRSELGVLRTQDKVLMSQFQRCNDSIEELKRQRPWYEVFSDEEEGEEDAGSKHWHDWEIEEFDRDFLSERAGRGSLFSRTSALSGGIGRQMAFSRESQRFQMSSLD